MLPFIAYLTINVSTDTLPNEQAALTKLQTVWRAATGGSGFRQPQIRNRWTSADRSTGELTFTNSDNLSYHFSDTRIYDGQFSREKDTAHLPVLSERLLLERSLAVIELLAPTRFTARYDSHGFSVDRSEFALTWSYVCDGYPTHRNPIQLRLDARTSNPTRLRAPSFNWRTDPAIKPRFSEAQCYQVAWAKYMNVKPMAVAPESHFGLRWVDASVEQDPALVAKATIPFAYWASDQYRSHFAEKRAVLAYSFWFGWQCVLVDAVTGEPMMVYGIDLYSQGRSSAAPPPPDPVIGKTWHLVTDPKAIGRLEPVDVNTEKKPNAKLVGLSSDKLALVGHYDSTTRTLRVEHPTGAKGYQASGSLARELEKNFR